MKLGEHLVENNWITEEQLQYCLDTQKESGGLLGEIIVSKALMTERHITMCLVFINDYKYLSLDELSLDAEVTSLLPKTMCIEFNVIPVRLSEKDLMLAMADPLDLRATREIKDYLGDKYTYDFRISEKSSIIREVGLMENSNILSDKVAEDMSPQRVYLEKVLSSAVRDNASDIHIEPYKNYMLIRFRIDGRLQTHIKDDKGVYDAIINIIINKGSGDLASKNVPQDLQFKYRVNSVKEVDIRVSLLPAYYGVKAVLRLLNNNTSLFVNFTSLGMSPREQDQVNRMLDRSYGIVLVCGPTGSGKSATLYSMLRKISSSDVNIVTVEDPVEFQFDGITQISVDTKMPFDVALRAVLRQDPDKIMIGEIRDGESAEVAIRSSMTGHLILSTLHTNTAVSAIDRLEDLGIERYLIAENLVGCISQRLVPKLCSCKKPYMASESQKESLSMAVDQDVELYSAVGCEKCNGGYIGRTGVFEILEVTPGIRKAIRHKATVSQLESMAVYEGMNKLKYSARKYLLSGIIDYASYRQIAFGL